MTEEIKAALTEAEWASFLSGPLHLGDEKFPYFFRHSDGAVTVDMVTDYDGETSSATGRQLQATAAVVLYGQPFGFTQEDVDVLRSVTARVQQWDALQALADRIAALLPPAHE